jgi:type I restriction enzyme R subunit
MSFNENSRVKIPALIHLEKLGYKYLSLKSLKYDQETNVVIDVLNESIQRINPNTSLSEIDLYLKQVFVSLANDDLGKAFHEHLINQSGIKLIDFENFENNTFNCVTEFECQKGLDSFRPDITILINGLPLVFVEVKKPNNKDGVLAERKRINSRFANKNFKKFINITQFVIFSNNMEYDEEDSNTIQGAFYSTTSLTKAKLNYFREELFNHKDQELLSFSPNQDSILKDTNLISIKQTPEFETNCQPNTPTNRILTSMLIRSRIAFLLRYGITYAEGYEGVEKHIMRYPQIFGTFAIEDKLKQGEKKGIIWHTQGSGKTALAYYNTRYLADYFQKQGQVGKFYFIVDRLNLLKQAKSEFSLRGLKVNTINSKSEFLSEFSKSQAISNASGKLEITVINIQKFAEEASEHFTNDYDLNIQRVYFIDEAHRSYKSTGSFFANLVSSDRNAIMICLTGTPLIGEFASKKIFGNYFHKYYYNSSIADGYTLRLIREEIESSYSSKLRKILSDLEIEKGNIPRSLILSHKNFVSPMLSYIMDDLVKARLMHGDQTIGGMVVCDSSEQAREMHMQFLEKYSSKFQSALILHDEGTKDERDDNSDDFKAGKIDILFVFNMLLTGFDAPRLKKIYLGRVVRDHNLLQTLTRVNRPYKNFKYGYVVDFADITDEFNSTNAAYFAELQEELGEELRNYSNLFVTEEEIISAVAKVKENLFSYELTNAEIFSTQISQIVDKKQIRSIISSLEVARDMYNLIKAFDYKELANKLDFEKLRLLLAETYNHLDLVLLKERIDISEEAKALLNTALEDITFTFLKTGEAELEIGNKLRDQIRRVREALAQNIDEQDPEFISLYDELRRILSKRNIQESSISDIDADIELLENILVKAIDLNLSNQRLAIKYGGDEKFARLHKMLRKNSSLLSDNEIYTLLSAVQNYLLELLVTNNNILNNKDYFETEILRSLSINLDINANYERNINMDDLALYIANEYFAELEKLVA